MRLVKVDEFEKRVLKARLQVLINVTVAFKSGSSYATFALVSGNATVDPIKGDVFYHGKTPVEFHFHLVMGHWKGTLAYEEIDNWPLVAGYKKMFSNNPTGLISVEISIPEGPRDDHVQVLYKAVDTSLTLAYNLNFIARQDGSRMHEVFTLDPRIINRPK